MSRIDNAVDKVSNSTPDVQKWLFSSTATAATSVDYALSGLNVYAEPQIIKAFSNVASPELGFAALGIAGGFELWWTFTADE